MVGERNTDQCCKMENDITAYHGLSNAMGVSHITGEYFDLFLNFFRHMVEPTPGIEAVIEDKRPDVTALSNQGFDKMGPDESISPRDQYFLIRDIQ